MNKVEIREAERKDLPEVLDLIKELAAFEHGLNQVTTTVEEMIEDGFGSNPVFNCLVATQNGKVIGTAIYYFSYSTWNGKCLYLEDLIVTRKIRSTGAGTQLMNKVIKIAKAEKVKRMSWQVLDWNLDAQDFYLKYGADLDGHWLNGRLDYNQLQRFKVE